MSKRKPPLDPYADREAEKYTNPIPSREFILDYLRASKGPLTHEEICRELNLQEDEHVVAMARRLRAMERDGQVASNRRGGYGTLEKLNLIKGRVIGHPEGFGFVTPLERGGEDIYLSSRQMRRVFDGDIVLVRVAGWDRRGRAEGTIVDVVERGTQQLVGRFFSESGIHFVRPDNPRISQDVMIPADQLGGAQPGQVVVVDIVEPPSRNHLPAGKISEVLGEHMAPGMEIEVAIRNYAIPHTWSERVVSEADKISDQVLEADKTHRVDLRDLPLVTIDGEDARDFDDAVYCKPKSGGGWTLYVAIADVSHYVKPGSGLDIEAYARGNSVYFPNHVVPMLPEKLSNGLCSLNPAQDRLCMVCEMQISPEGDISRYQFYEAVMHSRARLTYTQVAQVIAEREQENRSGVRKQFAKLLPQLDALHDLYLVLAARRAKRGAIDFDTPETRILFDAQRKISQIIPVQRTDAHRLIEECMLCANVCSARFLGKVKKPTLYRVHEGPGEEKLSALREFLGELGMGLGGGEDPQPEDYQRVLRAIASRSDASVIQSVMLRSMSQARYQEENLGHFGLAYDAYTHFTSPIRRYADLLVHRAIRSLIRSEKRVPHIKRVEGQSLLKTHEIYPYSDTQLAHIGEHISQTERRADEATRDVDNWLKCEFLLERVGEQYSGVVSAVTGFGLFVMLDELHVEGLIHVTGLPKDYYYHEQSHHRMVGERTGRVFRLGDKLRVQVVRVDLDERKIDFELVDQACGKKSEVVSGRALQLAADYEQGRQAKKKRGKNNPGGEARGDAARSGADKKKAAKPKKSKARSGKKSGKKTDGKRSAKKTARGPARRR